MGTYSNRNHLPLEASSGASVSHFTWFYPGSFLSASKNHPRPPSGTQFNPQPSLSVQPLRSVTATTEPANNSNSVTIPPKAKKQKSSLKASNKVPVDPLRPKQPKKHSSKKTKGRIIPEAKREKKNLNIDIDQANFDFSGVPTPYCSCTGVARNCYKWGAGGWQSSCCTISISEYPLPMSSTRPGARMAGRKMSNGAYSKLLLKLAVEGYDLSQSVDLKEHWARHGTNKFVTIK
ncbi:hypothetical protein K2173_009513 [Erythroxylum novogranatense]|uniref:GAGA-binding transcriptional activator n=1 Tax=Erythroxylum novogranatense TaxID=1862640 RepID=A0AAV8U443_9ROSI|nr:hypothetical protein K2173_009513 [Erythroxylum novogranatense]